ncbi:hypothetical protein [Streptomyces olivochromogenes]|uniref:hypothetical protein n=1 Tax=Streptomyces olivochromogenes TaxID=1963 RepID=UPI001F280BCC|nr:hypothetical protein [Streptomyces olivochromogenes]MCF3134472.1 hypothetical protein [Streptomyces olivochromogenes]
MRRSALGAQLHLPVAERTCPICSHVTMRVYHHEKHGRTTPAWITYLWCGDCHAYTSGFAGAGRKTVESDPLQDEYGARIAEVFRDTERLLKILDGYWKAGSLPQVISRRPRGR